MLVGVRGFEPPAPASRMLCPLSKTEGFCGQERYLTTVLRYLRHHRHHVKVHLNPRTLLVRAYWGIGSFEPARALLVGFFAGESPTPNPQNATVLLNPRTLPGFFRAHQPRALLVFYSSAAAARRR
jgi:hypothetical protein